MSIGANGILLSVAVIIVGFIAILIFRKSGQAVRIKRN